MEYRKLGKTGVDVGIIGLGTEYLENVSRETRISVIRESIDNGINYIDIPLPAATQRDDIGIALEAVMAEYNALSSKASDCLKCGDCVERCPFLCKYISP